MDYLQSFYFQYQNPFNFVLFLVGTVIAAHLVTYIFKHILAKITAKTKTQLDDRLISVIEHPMYWGVILGGVYLALNQLPFFEAYRATILVICKILFIAILLMVTIKISRILFAWISETSQLKKRQMGFLLTIQKVINALIYFIALIFILQAIGISISPLVASLGIGGLAVGLALQPTLSNYFSGLYVAAEGFIQPNDYIELDGMKGYVVSVGWRNTVIRLWNNNLVTIPNAKIADSIITNYNEPQNKSSFIVTCGVAYDSNLKKVEKIALEVAEKIQNKKKFGVPGFKPLFRYYEFGDSNIELKVILQADKFINHYLMKHEFIKELKAAFDKDGIVIAFPMQTLEYKGEPIEVSLKQ